MAFDITNIGTYVSPTEGYSTKAVASAPTVKKLMENESAIFGAKGNHSINKISQTITILDGSACSRTGGSQTALSNRTVTIVPLKSEDTVCSKSLWNSFFSKALLKGQTPNEDFKPEFANLLMTSRVEAVAAENEKLIWQGDTSLTGSTNLKRMNGILKVAADSATTVTATGTTAGTTYVEKLHQVYNAVSATERHQADFFIAIGEDTYDYYLQALAAKNIYKPVEDVTLYGTTAKLFVCSGLNGTGKAYADRWSNIVVGMDSEADASATEIMYDATTKNFFMDVNYALGVQVAFPENAVIASGL